MRAVYGARRGPLREVHGGSGYSSHDSVVQVLGLSGEPTAVWVRWPDGSEALQEIETGQVEVVVRR